MLLLMTSDAERNKIFTLVATEPAAAPKMMRLQLRRRTTDLAAPAVALQNLTPEFGVLLGSQIQSRLFLIQAGCFASSVKVTEKLKRRIPPGQRFSLH
jgi:hypothetical protein